FEKIGAGERNSKLVSLAGYLHYKFPTEIVEVLVQKVNDVWCEPPLDEEEVEDIVRKNYKQYHAGK
ncbi:MAG TPA: primase alpha helix C-terminal domain-containing protein, partial [Phormidium sp.]